MRAPVGMVSIKKIELDDSAAKMKVNLTFHQEMLDGATNSR